MKNRIYITRHGQDQDNVGRVLNGHRDQPLTEIGKMQAAEVAQKIQEAGIVFDIVLTSPLQRASETAEIIAKKLGSPSPAKEELLIERDFGVMTGKPVASIIGLCAPDVLETEHINYFLSPEGAETFPDLVGRGKKLLDKLDREYEAKNILLVTHGDIGKMLYASYYHQDWQEVLKAFHFGNSDLLLLAEDSPAGETHIFQIQQHQMSK